MLPRGTKQYARANTTVDLAKRSIFSFDLNNSYLVLAGPKTVPEHDWLPYKYTKHMQNQFN